MYKFSDASQYIGVYVKYLKIVCGAGYIFFLGWGLQAVPVPVVLQKER